MLTTEMLQVNRIKIGRSVVHKSIQQDKGYTRLSKGLKMTEHVSIRGDFLLITSVVVAFEFRL